MHRNRTKMPRPIRKSWSYKQLTEATEAQIRSDASFLKNHLKELQDPRDSHRTVMQVSSWSHGAFQLWLRLTSEWQKEGDEKRLRELVNSVVEVRKEEQELTLPVRMRGASSSDNNQDGGTHHA